MDTKAIKPRLEALELVNKFYTIPENRSSREAAKKAAVKCVEVVKSAVAYPQQAYWSQVLTEIKTL